jgi:hypothetical protein
MKPYQPSLTAPAGGLVILLVFALFGGAAVGAAFSFLSNLVYIILIFPILMGLSGGWLVATGVRVGKIRHPGVALGAALLAGLVLYAALWFCNYAQFHGGQVDFVGYVLYVNQKGVMAVLLGSNGGLLNLGPLLSAVYWAVELLLIVWLVVITGHRPAYAPFSEICGRWFEKPALMGTLGSRRTKEVMGLIESGQFLKLGEELQTNPALPNLGIFLVMCEKEATPGEAYLALRSQTRDTRGNPAMKDIAAGTILIAQAKDLLQGIENRKALYGN